MSIYYLVGLIIKLFLLLTPFFVLSVFVSTCDGMEFHQRRKLALRTGMAVIFASLILYLFGKVMDINHSSVKKPVALSICH